MKIKTLLILALFCFIQTANSQNIITVSQTVESIYNENGSALKATVYRASEKTILKEWKSIMKGYDAVVKVKGEEVYASEVLIGQINSVTIEVFMKVKEISESKHEVSFIFKSGGDYISSSNDISGYTAAEAIVFNFATELSKNATEKYFEEEEKILSGIVNSLEKLVREKKKAEGEIEDCKETIKENEYKIVENKKSQVNTVTLIEEQKKKVRNAKKAKEQFN